MICFQDSPIEVDQNPIQIFWQFLSFCLGPDYRSKEEGQQVEEKQTPGNTFQLWRETTKQSIGVKMIVQKSSVKLGPELKILNEDIVVSKQKDAGTERQWNQEKHSLLIVHLNPRPDGGKKEISVEGNLMGRILSWAAGEL